MSDDCSARKEQAETLRQQIQAHRAPNNAYAKRVERVVCSVCGIAPAELHTATRQRKFAYARFLVFAILWQPHGFRSLNWLGDRFGLKHWSVYHGILLVHKDLNLKTQYTTAMELLVTELEIELFGSRIPTP